MTCTPRAQIVLAEGRRPTGETEVSFQSALDVDPESLDKDLMEYPVIVAAAVLRNYFTSEQFFNDCKSFVTNNSGIQLDGAQDESNSSDSTS